MAITACCTCSDRQDGNLTTLARARFLQFGKQATSRRNSRGILRDVQSVCITAVSRLRLTRHCNLHPSVGLRNQGGDRDKPSMPKHTYRAIAILTDFALEADRCTLADAKNIGQFPLQAK